MLYGVALVREHRERQMRLVFGSMAKLSPFALFTIGAVVLVWKTGLREQTGKTVKGGLGSPQNFSLFSLLVTKERMKTRNGKLKSEK